jgi:hypothetical protein
MKMLLSFAMLLMLCGCQTPAPPASAPPADARLSRAQALAIAKQAAAEHNVFLLFYQRPQADFYSTGLYAGDWSVFWPNHAETKGFDVFIDDKTGKIVSAKVETIYKTAPPSPPTPPNNAPEPMRGVP